MKYRSIAEAVLLLGLIILSGMQLTDANSYFCDSKKIALNCDKVSGTRCYFNDGTKETYKICSEGWQKLSDFVEKPPFFVELAIHTEVKDYTTSPNGKTCFLSGDLRRGISC